MPYTHIYACRHIKGALKAGATMKVLKLCVVQGAQACNLGVPMDWESWVERREHQGRLDMLNERLNRIKEKGVEEGRKLLGIFLYLWVLLGLFAIHKSIVLNEEDLFYHQGFVVFNAFLLAKVVLTADIFHTADNLNDKPLIYPIVFKSIVFSTILILFYLAEEILLGMWHGKSFVESIPAIGNRGLKGILTVGIIMAFVLMPFFALREIGRDIGGDRLYELFFVRRTKFALLQS
jgi:hypothetical protein